MIMYFVAKNTIKSSLPALSPPVRMRSMNSNDVRKKEPRYLNCSPIVTMLTARISIFEPFWPKTGSAPAFPFLPIQVVNFPSPYSMKNLPTHAFLRLPLECGVQVIVATGAGKSGIWDPDYTTELLKMMDEFPNLFTDNSALASPNRWRAITPLWFKIQERADSWK